MKVENKTIIITDPCYIVPDDKDDDWFTFCKSGYLDHCDGITNYIVSSTKVGDWSCTTFDINGEHLGTFTADSGTVGVFELDEIIKYNPNFPGDLPKRCYTQIDNFSGNINIEEEYGVTVIGDGNIEFHTEQTGW